MVVDLFYVASFRCCLLLAWLIVYTRNDHTDTGGVMIYGHAAIIRSGTQRAKQLRVRIVLPYRSSRKPHDRVTGDWVLDKDSGKPQWQDVAEQPRSSHLDL